MQRLREHAILCRSSLAVACLFALTPFALRAAPPAKLAPPGPESWPSFRNGLLQTGVATTKLPDKLELLWTYKSGDKDAMIKSTAAIVGDRVYVGSLNGELVCLDLHNGTRLWSYRSGEAAGPNAFIPGFKTAPAVTGDAVYIGDEEGGLHAVDRATGKGRWKFEAGAEIANGVNVYDGRVLFGSHDNNLYCLNADGTKAWSYATEGQVYCSPAVVGQSTFVAGCDGHLRVIDVRTGQQQADLPLDIQLTGSPAVMGEMLYVGTHGGEVLAIDWKAPRKVWTYKSELPFHSSAAVTDKFVVIGGEDRQLHCIDRLTGKKVWTFTTKAYVDSSPVIVGERVFFGSNDGNLYGVTLADGKEVFRFKDGRDFTASPAVGEKHLVIGSESRTGNVYCFGAKR